MKRTKLYKLIIAALVIINVGILVFFYFGRHPHGPHKSEDLIKKIGIDQSKEALINRLEKDHHEKKKALMKTNHKLHQELFSKLGTDADVSSIQSKIEANHAEIEKMTYSFFNEVAKHSNAEQTEKMKKMIGHVFNQMSKPPKK